MTRLKFPLKVYINGRLKATVKTRAQAWKVIGSSSFGAGYTVRDARGDVVPEFITL